MQHYECNKEQEITRIESKTDRIIEQVTESKIDLAKMSVLLETQSKILEDHIKRTEVAELRLDKLELPYKIIAFAGVPIGFLWTIIGVLLKLGVM